MKTIVTHIGPDLDAIMSVWLIKMFLPGWEEAAIAFVPAGKTMDNAPVDADPEIIHVDTGFGQFDHHQTNEDTCAALLVWNDVKFHHGEDAAIIRMLTIVNDIDHFREVFYPNPAADFWEFGLVAQIEGWRLLYADNPLKIVTLGMECLDGVYKLFQNKVWADKEIKEKGKEFQTKWGKALAIETPNDEVVRLGQKNGYVMVVRRDPKKGYLRIKAIPKDEIDLAPFCKTFEEKDPSATWFLHASHHMILNGSTKNPDMRPTTLSLNEIIDILKKK